MKLYVVVDIGCIECGEGSNVVLLTEDKELADSICKREEEHQNKNWTGQHRFEVFEREVGNDYGAGKEV